MPLRLLACLAVLTCAVPALAQAPGEVEPLAPLPAPAAPAPKNPSTALSLSLGVTLGGVALVLTSGSIDDRGAKSAVSLLGLGLMYLGPATGHWYAGEIGGVGLGLRAAALTGATLGLVQAVTADGCDTSCPSSTEIETLLITSSLLWLGSTIYDIATAPRAARSWNRAHGVAFGPTAMRAANGGTAPGVAFALRF